VLKEIEMTIDKFNNELTIIRSGRKLYSRLLSDEAKYLINSFISTAYKNILGTLLLDKIPFEVTNYNKRNYFYVRTDNIDDDTDVKIKELIKTSKSYEELVSKVEELGFKNLKDVIII
jgi:hypothetical protein